MGQRITDQDRARAPQVTPGQRVCVVGQGTANLVHVHLEVRRVTATMIIAGPKGSTDAGRESRFTRDRSARSIPYSLWGGTSLHTSCQRPRKTQP